jgi:hypothetical protein
MGGRPRYTTPGGFGEREPLAMWADIVAAGFRVHEVRVVAVAGGELTTCEALLARALGAEVVWLDPASESNVALEDQLPNGTDHVLELIADPMTLRAFLVWPPRERLEDALRVRIARYLHQDYRERHKRGKSTDDPALRPWERLVPALQRSNLAAADDIPNKLAVIGKRIAVGGQRLDIGSDEVELLAEMEHGRFAHERLSAGWQAGRRHVMRMVSPYLKPWDELDDIRKQSDRDAVKNIAEALDRAGYGVADALPREDATPSPSARVSA